MSANKVWQQKAWGWKGLMLRMQQDLLPGCLIRNSSQLRRRRQIIPASMHFSVWIGA